MRARYTPPIPRGARYAAPARRAAEKANREDELAAAPIRERSRDEPGGKRDEGKDSDDEAHGFVGSAQIVAHMWPDFRQHSCDSQKAEEGRGSHSPELGRKLSQ